MAEYIDRKQIKYLKERVLNHWAGSSHTDCDVTQKSIITKQDIESMPAADVVERKKIDKTIEEMERYSTSFEYANRHDLASAVDCCIGMIQKI